MARNIRIISARDFVSAKPDGQLNLEESEHLLREVVGVSEPLEEEFDILIDTREAASTLSATDLWFLADRLVKYPKTFAGRTAILCPAERFDHASFFALCAENKGIDMQAFTSYEEAMTWLSAGR
ncbi:MAG TPA: hypothetical protein VFZ81_06805 [Burkholderiales bacterium]